MPEIKYSLPLEDPEKWMDCDVWNFKTPEDAKKAEERLIKMKRVLEALQDWAYQYPDRHLLEDYKDIFEEPRHAGN